ncbi:MAG: serine/threonine-protein kinase, partial [Vicinamibacteria bacterium]|nr:serine/threonine-protein kinase [Vicinamibacteria bacterium]
PASVAGDTDRLARFQREAEVLASLNHPNIAAIYGLEKTPDLTALVMELVEGEDLSQRIARGAIPLADALQYSRQIAEAIEAAHEQGIIHRDLKPANIKVRSDGTVKVLDFGLAKAMEPAAGSSPSMSMSPTITTPAMTQAGIILGTAAYMSPEQARGRTVDKRADVWAFGAVLFEMLTSRRAFSGEDITDTIVSVVSKEPDWSALPAATPAGLRRLLARCLKKDPKARMRDIGEARLQLEELVSSAPEEIPAAGVAAPASVPRALWKRAVPVVATAVVAGALVGAAAWRLRPPVSSSPVTRFALTLGEGQQFGVANNQRLAVSADGTRLVYVANYQLYMRSMSDGEARPIPGTHQMPTPYAPVFSPDSQSIAFYSMVDSAIKKIAVSGGAAVTLCPAAGNVGRLNWDNSGIVFSQPKGITRVPADGGQPEVLVSAKDGEVMDGPQVLPGGEWLLFTIATAITGVATAETWDKAQIVVQSLKSSERKTLVSGGSAGWYLPTGHLVYALGGVLFAVPFDLPRLAVTGGPVPVVEGILRSTNAGRSAVAQFSVSSTGSLVFVPGPVSTSMSGSQSVGLFDRKGGSELLKIPPGPYQTPRMSPDGKRIAFESDDGKEASLWIYELSRMSSMRRLTFEGQGHNRFPVWSADSQRIAFQSDREGDLGIFWQRADGTGTAERLTKADERASHIPESWAAGGADGERLLYNAGKGGATALWVLSLKDRKAARFDSVESPADTLTGAVFSPDGRWVAYASREGRTSSAVYVQPFPATGARYQISKNADDGHHPVWSPDGAELVFTPGPVPRLDAVRVTTQPSFTFSEATPVPRPFQNLSPLFERPYDISRDGQRFLGLIDAAQTQAGAPAAPQIQVVLNWFEELKAKVPTR